MHVWVAPDVIVHVQVYVRDALVVAVAAVVVVVPAHAPAASHVEVVLMHAQVDVQPHVARDAVMDVIHHACHRAAVRVLRLVRVSQQIQLL